MRSKMITVATVAASLLLAPLMASADAVQEQLRLMEQRMAEMEDRLQETSVELQSAKATVDQQQGLLSDAGLIEANDSGLRSGVSDFFDMVEIDGVLAASYNQRLKRAKVNTGNNSGTTDGNQLFRHENANTFQVDQLWVNIGKTPTEESRGGFHAAIVTGTTADAQGGNGDFTPYLYDAYVSYLFDCDCGLQVDAGLLPTVFGAEVIQADQNFFVTTGALFGLQPVTYTGVQLSGRITDEISFQAGVVNEVYDPTFISVTADKAYFARVSAEFEKMSFSAGAIHGSDQTSDLCVGSDCNTTVVDVVMTADPTDDLSLWVNFDYVITGGEDRLRNGHAYGISAAGRLALTENTGVSSRVEWIMMEDGFTGTQAGGTANPTDDIEKVTLTGTVDHALSEHVTARGEVRWDTFLDDDGSQFAGDNNDQVVALAELFFSF